MLWPFVANNTCFFYMSIRDNEHLNDSHVFFSGFVYQFRSGLKSTNVTIMT